MLVEIPSREWAHLQSFEERDRDVFKYENLDRYEPYTKVRFRRDDLVRLWPRPEPKASAEVECRRWLVGIMRESRERPKPKAQLQAEALKKSPGLGVLGFKRAWNLAIEEAAAPQWKRAGRRTKKSNQNTN
jgi:hypothetical protein